MQSEYYLNYRIIIITRSLIIRCFFFHSHCENVALKISEIIKYLQTETALTRALCVSMCEAAGRAMTRRPRASHEKRSQEHVRSSVLFVSC